MKCEKCNSELFRVIIKKDCSDCPENGTYDEDEDNYIYSETIIEEKGLIRDQVDNEGECAFGTAHGTGCWIITCDKCGAKDYMPMVST